MKILYIAPEHVSGGFSLFVKGHARLGNSARYVTFYRNLYGFEEDICLDLVGMPTSKWVEGLKGLLRIGDRAHIEFDSTLPIREKGGITERMLYSFRDTINAQRIERTIEEFGLDDYDLYHFEQGVDPYRDERWVKRLAASGKRIVCFYHGTDIRSRGIFKEVHRASRLNLTSEIDLLDQVPGMRYLYLPIDTDELKPDPRPSDGRIRIAHAARNRRNKGSDHIEEVVGRLARRFPVDWVMIENRPHHEAISLKSKADIFIDQLTDLGGWGYGASSVESLALGIPTITRINRRVADFLGDHPFINADGETLEQALVHLIEDADYRQAKGIEGRRWIIGRHGLDAVMAELYGYYSQAGLI